MERVFSFQRRQTMFPLPVRLTWTPKYSFLFLTAPVNLLHLLSLLVWHVVSETSGSQRRLCTELLLTESRTYWPAVFGSNRTSCSHLLQLRQTRMFHCGWENESALQSKTKLKSHRVEQPGDILEEAVKKGCSLSGLSISGLGLRSPTALESVSGTERSI